jgi:hypothetical protein
MTRTAIVVTHVGPRPKSTTRPRRKASVCSADADRGLLKQGPARGQGVRSGRVACRPAGTRQVASGDQEPHRNERSKSLANALKRAVTAQFVPQKVF